MWKNYRKLSFYSLVVMLGIGFQSCLYAEHIKEDIGYERHYRSIKGIAVTGFNSLLSEPIWDLGGQLGTVKFDFIFAHNPGASEPLPLVEDTPKSTELATGIDEGFFAAIGVPVESIDQKFVNKTLRNLPIIVNGVTAERMALPSVLDTAVPTEASLSLPNDPITLGSWLSAKGVATVRCSQDGTAKIRFKFKNLVENGIYTIWGIYGIDTDKDGQQDQIIPAALGGIPNAFVPGKNGKADVTRTLSYCPVTDKRLKVIDVAYHSDANVYGASVDLYLPGFPGILVANTHIAFPFQVEKIKD